MLYGTGRDEKSAGTGNEKAGYNMGTDHRDHAVKIAAVLLAALLSGGCSHASYEKITAAETVAETASDIVLETEPETEFKTGSETEPETDRLEENPEASDPVEPADGSMTILFSGDVLLSDHVLNAYSRAGGISGVLDQRYLSAIQSADYFAVNEEFPFSSRGTQAAGCLWSVFGVGARQSHRLLPSPTCAPFQPYPYILLRVTTHRSAGQTSRRADIEVPFRGCGNHNRW